MNTGKLFKKYTENFVLYSTVFCPNTEKYGAKKPCIHGGFMYCQPTNGLGQRIIATINAISTIVEQSPPVITGAVVVFQIYN